MLCYYYKFILNIINKSTNTIKLIRYAWSIFIFRISNHYFLPDLIADFLPDLTTDFFTDLAADFFTDLAADLTGVFF